MTSINPTNENVHIYTQNVKNADSSFYEIDPLSHDIGNTSSSETLKEGAENASKKEGTTLSKIGHTVLRGLAGLSGGTLYGATFLLGGGLTLAVATPLLLCVPVALLGAGFGAIMGFINPDSTVIKGAGMGGMLAFASSAAGYAILATVTTELFKLLLFKSVGELGAGLCAFAITGENEETQLNGPKYQSDESFVIIKGDEFRISKSTNEKLLDALCFVTFPYFYDKYSSPSKIPPIRIHSDDQDSDKNQIQ